MQLSHRNLAHSRPIVGPHFGSPSNPSKAIPNLEPNLLAPGFQIRTQKSRTCTAPPHNTDLGVQVGLDPTNPLCVSTAMPGPNLNRPGPVTRLSPWACGGRARRLRCPSHAIVEGEQSAGTLPIAPVVRPAASRFRFLQCACFPFSFSAPVLAQYSLGIYVFQVSTRIVPNMKEATIFVFIGLNLI